MNAFEKYARKKLLSKKMIRRLKGTKLKKLHRRSKYPPYVRKKRKIASVSADTHGLKIHAETIYHKSVIRSLAGKGISNQRYQKALDQIERGKLKSKSDVNKFVSTGRDTKDPEWQDFLSTVAPRDEKSWKALAESNSVSVAVMKKHLRGNLKDSGLKTAGVENMNALEKHAAKSQLKMLLGRALEGGVRNLTPHKAPASILAHEYGHAKTLLGASPRMRKLRMFGYGKLPAYAGIANMAHGAAAAAGAIKVSPKRTALQAMGIRAVGETPRLVEEFLASYHGLKALKKFKHVTPKTYKTARKDLLNAYATYLANATTAVTTAGLTGRVYGGGKAFMGRKNIGPFMFLGENVAATAGGIGAQLIAMHGMKKGMKTGLMLSKRQQKQLAKAMGQGNVSNIQPRTGKRNPLGGFFMPPIKEIKKQLSPSDKRWLKKNFGSKGAKELIERGGISVPRGTKRETRGFGKKNWQDKLLDKARELQKG
jgi:hypothetical protein